MNLNADKWKEFQINKIFDIYTGGDLILGDVEEGEIPIASNSAENNNIACYTSPIEGRTLFDHKKTISIADRGKFWAFVQSKDFYLGTRAKGLVYKDSLNLSINHLIFLATIINKESFKFSYGRNCCDNLPYITIKLPNKKNSDGSDFIDSDKLYHPKGFVPDWDFIENYICSLHHKPISTKNKKERIYDLKNKQWAEFPFTNLFSVIGTTTTPKETLEEYGFGDFPYVTTSASNNGTDGRYNFYTEEGNVIIIESACLGFATYQKEKFSASDHAEKCVPKFALNEKIAQFLITIINYECYKYSYGRKCNHDRIKEKILKLPIKKDSNGKPIIDNKKEFNDKGYIPDWKFMEDYISSLPYGDKL